MKINTLRIKSTRAFKQLFVACILLSSSVIFTGCPEDSGPVSPDVDTSKNYITANILGNNYDLSFDADQVTYKDDYEDGITIITITGNMLLDALFYDLTITIYDKHDGKTRYAIIPKEAKVKFVVSDLEVVDEFNINPTGTIDITYNDENRFTGTFKFSIETYLGDKTITFSNGKFNYNKPIRLITSTQTSQ